MRFSFFFVLSLIIAAPAWAQAPKVYVETNLPGAVLVVDSTQRGPVELQPFSLQPGVRDLTLLPPQEKGWSISPLMREVDVRAGDTLRVSMPFPYYYRVGSAPSEAEVYHLFRGERLLLGLTPLLYTQPQPLAGELVVTAPGHVSERVDPGAAVWNAHVLYLEPIVEPRSAQINWNPPDSPNYWIDVAASALAVAATGLSIHYKFKADDLYNAYARTGDPALQESYEIYDRRALVALGVGQVGLGILAIRFALR